MNIITTVWGAGEQVTYCTVIFITIITTTASSILASLKELEREAENRTQTSWFAKSDCYFGCDVTQVIGPRLTLKDQNDKTMLTYEEGEVTRSVRSPSCL